MNNKEIDSIITTKRRPFIEVKNVTKGYRTAVGNPYKKTILEQLEFLLADIPNGRCYEKGDIHSIMVVSGNTGEILYESEISDYSFFKGDKKTNHFLKLYEEIIAESIRRLI